MKNSLALGVAAAFEMTNNSAGTYPPTWVGEISAEVNSAVCQGLEEEVAAALL